MRVPPFFEDIGADLRFALRGYRRSPGFTITALVAIALGVGATTAVFSVVDRVLFRPLPYAHAERLVSVGMVAKVVGDDEFLFAADYKDLRDAGGPFQATTSWSGVNDCDITDGAPVRQRCAEVDASFLPVFGVKPLLGAGFREEDDRPGAAKTVMLGYGVWQSRFGGNREVVGRTVSVDGEPARIVGVLPRTFELPTLQHADLLVPQVITDAGWRHGATRVLWAYGRLREGLNLQKARTELEPIFAQMLENVPPPFRKEVVFRVRSLRDRKMENVKRSSLTLFAAVVVVLLISCANVANLLLARGAGRQAEIAIRRALGVTRARLARQMLTESLMLAVAGGAIGCAVGAGLLRMFVAVAPNGMPSITSASLDGRVLAFSLGVSVLAGLIFGMAPALERSRQELLGSSRTVTNAGSSTMKHLLVAGQIALSTVLLAAAGLLVRSLWNIESQSLGIQTQHVVTVQLVLPASRYKTPEQRVAFFNAVEQKLSALPGVRGLGLSDSLPPGGWERARPLSSMEVRGQPRHGTGTGGMIAWRYVTPGYFDVLRIAVVAGHGFTEQERRPGETLAIVSQSLARRLFPGRNAVGQYFRTGTENWVRVVGVAADVKNAGLTARDDPEYYILRTHAPDDTYLHSTGPVAQRTLSILIRSAFADDVTVRAVREKLAEIDSTQPVEFATMRTRLRDMEAQPRLDALLLILFAAIGLFLAAVGLYGTLAFLVVQRTQEIGIRMSLGARPGQIVGGLLGEASRWAAAGAVAGAVAALGTTRILSSLLFRVSASDPVTLFGSMAVLLLVVLVATVNPARRAATVDPMKALRQG